MATKHQLIGNCVACGRVMCAQEGAGACLFCGEGEVGDVGAGMNEVLVHAFGRRSGCT